MYSCILSAVIVKAGMDTNISQEKSLLSRCDITPSLPGAMARKRHFVYNLPPKLN